jgi:hypothetical protein
LHDREFSEGAPIAAFMMQNNALATFGERVFFVH